MKCEICQKSVIKDGIAVFRINSLGETGIWRCRKHLSDSQKTSIDPQVNDIVTTIEETNQSEKFSSNSTPTP